AHDDIVVAALGLENDVAPPARHGEENGGDANGENHLPGTRSVHRQDEAESRDKPGRRADKRPRARVDEMKSRPVRNRRVAHGLLPLLIIPRAPRDRLNDPPTASPPAVQTSYRTA